MPLQKSLSDQDHSVKKKSPWSRNRSFQDSRRQSNNTVTKSCNEKPLASISDSTKNKLNGFQFGTTTSVEITASKAAQDASETEKENAVIKDPKSSRDSQNTMKMATEASKTISQNARKEVPATPSGKLALPDLIGMGDVRRAVPEISPHDRIGWAPGNNIIENMNMRKAKKRARSSSPTSSPSPAHLGYQFDPGSELWGRYSTNGSGIPQGAALPALAHIMHTSSPQALNRGILGFKRSNSCGNQFPKRRRIGGTEGGDECIESIDPGPSKLSALLEKVQEGLAHSQPVDELDISMTSVEFGSSSPLRQKARFSPPSESKESPLVNKNGTSAAGQPHDSDASSDYGEFDDDLFDDEILEGATSTPKTREDTSDTTSNIPPSNSTAIPSVQVVATLEKSRQPQLDKAEPPPLSTVYSNSEEDEFGDLDDDVFEVDLENIVAETNQDPKFKPKAILETPEMQQGRGSEIDSDDEFGEGIDDFDFEAVEAAATQPTRVTPDGLLPPTRTTGTIQRYLVMSISENHCQIGSGRLQPEKILILQAERSKRTEIAHLRGVWFMTPATSKAYVHIIGERDSSGQFIIDDLHGMIILHPDHLVSSTVVADSFTCTRRAVLQDRVKATSDSSTPLVYGTILHEVFQAAMLANKWDTIWLEELILSIVKNHIEDLYKIRVSIPQAVEHLQSRMGDMQSWASIFVSGQPKPEATVTSANGIKTTMCVNKLLDVEEHVWSPMYGLKGNIDATVQVTMVEGSQSRTLTVPFEVKTGRNQNAAHRAQTALYTLLLSDRYDIEILYGILYYMETSETIKIPGIRRELCHMLMQRNELACFVRERQTQLPPMLKNQNQCGRCYAKVPCFIYHKLADNGDGESSGMRGKFDEVVKHLTPVHKEFFLKWDDLLTKEEKEAMKFRRELWTMLSSEREKLGRCFANVIIEPGSAYEEKNSPKINRYRYTLVKESAPSSFSFVDSQIIVGEPIVISDEKGHFALANGYVTAVRKSRITVAVDRRLHNARIRGPGFDEMDNQVFASIMEVAPEGSSVAEAKNKIVEEPIRFRLDKDEFSNGMALVRNNLIQVMAEGPFGSRAIRNLVVDLAKPRFKEEAAPYVLSKEHGTLNIDQRRAVDKVMTAEDYALVLGMPGTGKTTTIAHIIRALVSQGKSVLLTSYTHTAVDNILLKLKSDNIPILRLGTAAKINKEVQEFAMLAATPKSTFEDIKSAWHDTPIVATTCLGISHALFNERTFDYCIVDEASQITLPVCLGPIRQAKTFILVGDHNQLPPLVQNEEARNGGLDISLFKHLSDSHPSSVVYLEHQYRMCEEVQTLSNMLIYNGRLKCGSAEVASSSITIPNMDALNVHHYSSSILPPHSEAPICAAPAERKCWIRDLLDPKTKVAFINTDTLLPASREEAKGNRIVNPVEAAICTQLVESLLTVGVPGSSIGVMTHYRSQLSLLKHKLRNHNDIEMHTADRFQGRDKEVVILTLVRSNANGSIGELLKDWRRINVAFTRAKTKLLVIGSRDTLICSRPDAEGKQEMVSRFVSLMETKNWIYDLPTAALDAHTFDDLATQLSASAPSRPSTTQWVRIDKPPAPTNDKENAELAEWGWKNNPLPGGAAPRPTPKAGNPSRMAAKRSPKKILGERPVNLHAQPVLQDILHELMGN